jgi:hypothetical protein
MSDAIRLHGTTIASAALRHEVPLAIGDPFAFLEIDGRPAILTNTLEHARVFQARPGAQLTLLDELGYHDLVRQGVRRSQAQLEAVSRWVARHGLRDTVVPPDLLPVAVSDRLRADGVLLHVDEDAFDARRRVSLPASAARSAPQGAGMAAAAALLRTATAADGRLRADDEPLTAEHVRAAIRGSAPRRALRRRRTSWSRARVGRRARPGQRPPPRRPAGHDRPVAPGRDVGLLGRPDPHVRRRAARRRGAAGAAACASRTSSSSPSAAARR